ncbi:MAG: hypothetical protein HONDAALG_04398 [Gammaproteobacteria bacterium]|nr:hypothetical protein [Gammaproteobacteria bacterium]
MIRTRALLTSALLIFLIGIIPATACMHKREGMQQQPDAAITINQGDQKLRLSIPNAEWEPMFFKSLETYTKKINLPNLRTVVLPNKDDLEVRFWTDALPSKLDGIILRRINNQWSAVGIHVTGERKEALPTQKKLAVPKSGWDKAWEKLVGAGILTLPDASEVNCNVTTIDGLGFVAEINFNWSYRTYAYGNPQLAECNEAKRIISIRQIIFDEFAL